jgi:hypothetical protein
MACIVELDSRRVGAPGMKRIHGRARQDGRAEATLEHRPVDSCL